MKRAFYYLIKTAALVSRIFGSRRLYMCILKKAHELNGVQFEGRPRFIHPNVVLDATGGIVLGDNIVISTGVLFLTHDYSFTSG